MRLPGVPVSCPGCKVESQSMAAIEVTPCATAQDQSRKVSAINDSGTNISANLAMAKKCIQLARFSDNQHEGLEDQHTTQNTVEPTQVMPYGAAYFFDALHIQHACIFSRSGNPWLGVAVASSPIWFMLPYNIMLFGYLLDYHPVIFPSSLGVVAFTAFHIWVSLRLPPHQVNKSLPAMLSVLPGTICFSLCCLGSLVLSVLPGGHSVPGGSLLVFCSLLFICIFVIVYTVRFLSSR